MTNRLCQILPDELKSQLMGDWEKHGCYLDDLTQPPGNICLPAMGGRITCPNGNQWINLLTPRGDVVWQLVTNVEHVVGPGALTSPSDDAAAAAAEGIKVAHKLFADEYLKHHHVVVCGGQQGRGAVGGGHHKKRRRKSKRKSRRKSTRRKSTRRKTKKRKSKRKKSRRRRR